MSKKKIKRGPTKSAKGEARSARGYEPPRLSRVDLPGLSGELLDERSPLLAQGGQPSSNVEGGALFPPPPTPP